MIKRRFTRETGYPMAEKLNDGETVGFDELDLANTIQIDALSQLLIEKGLITEQDFFTKLKLVQREWAAKKENLYRHLSGS